MECVAEAFIRTSNKKICLFAHSTVFKTPAPVAAGKPKKKKAKAWAPRW